MRLRRFAARRFRPLAIAAACLGLAATLYAERGGIAAYPWQLSWATFAAAVALFSLAPIAGAASFRILLHDRTRATPVVAAAHVWMRGFAARYVPSGALTMAVRLRAREQLAAGTRDIWAASLLEQGVAAAAGATAATVAFAAARRVPVVAPVLLVGALAAGAASSKRRRALALALVATVAAWAASGTGAWLLVRAMAPATPGFAYVVGAYAFAWLVGFVVVFAPSGFGIREATLVALLAPRLGAAPAVVVAVALRLANTVGDLLAFSLVEAGVAVYLHRSTRDNPGDSAGPPRGGAAAPVLPSMHQRRRTECPLQLSRD